MSSGQENSMSDTRANNYTQRYPVVSALDIAVNLTFDEVNRKLYDDAKSELDDLRNSVKELSKQLDDANIRLAIHRGEHHDVWHDTLKE